MASTVLVAQTDDLSNIFQNLRSKNSDLRDRAAEDLRRYVCPTLLSTSAHTLTNNVGRHQGIRDDPGRRCEDMGRHNQSKSV